MTKPKKYGRKYRRQVEEEHYGFLKHMPPSRLKQENGSFDLFDCEVLDFALGHEGLKQHRLNEIRNSGFIEYDGETDTWHGIEYDKDSEEW